MILGFPFVLIYTLFSFIPSIDIIDKNIDIEKQKSNDKNNQELEYLINKNIKDKPIAPPIKIVYTEKDDKEDKK